MKFLPSRPNFLRRPILKASSPHESPHVGYCIFFRN